MLAIYFFISVIFVPANRAKGAIIEAIDATRDAK